MRVGFVCLGFGGDERGYLSGCMIIRLCNTGLIGTGKIMAIGLIL